VKFNIDIE